ncbi:hypothetical protein AB0958_19250 [Streptomyces sp. NPDC006655]|uniref:hypothetical protein n=1 Tax=Streptomyces sp. NPDC006655 TaxID=3156898 RepID=UPI0034531574
MAIGLPGLLAWNTGLAPSPLGLSVSRWRRSRATSPRLCLVQFGEAVELLLLALPLGRALLLLALLLD